MALRASSVIFCGKIIFFAIKFDFFDVFRGLNNLFVFWQKKLTGVSQQQITCTAEKNGAHFVKHLFFCIIFGLLAEKHGLLAKNWQGFQNFFYVSRGTALGRFFWKKKRFLHFVRVFWSLSKIILIFAEKIWQGCQNYIIRLERNNSWIICGRKNICSNFFWFLSKTNRIFGVKLLPGLSKLQPTCPGERLKDFFCKFV